MENSGASSVSPGAGMRMIDVTRSVMLLPTTAMRRAICMSLKLQLLSICIAESIQGNNDEQKSTPYEIDQMVGEPQYLEAGRKQHQRNQCNGDAKHPAFAARGVGASKNGNQNSLQKIGCTIIRLGSICAAGKDNPGNGGHHACQHIRIKDHAILAQTGKNCSAGVGTDEHQVDAEGCTRQQEGDCTC